MSRPYRTLNVVKGKVDCLTNKREDLDHCRFCAHSVRFRVGGKEVMSPARAFCNLSRATEDVDLTKVEAVICDDMVQEGFRSIMNIIG
ncbi:MAG TPA: hypothetical protein VN372_14180 [Methanospirillum sp.]|nr:hypothetical protein [Methanospirillum sp.]